jgi:cellulose synthase (UDP-forming)
MRQAVPQHPALTQQALHRARPVSPPAGKYRPTEQPMRGQRIVYALMFSLGLVVLARFGYFWFDAARLPRDFGRHIDAGDIALFAALTFVVWHRVLIDLSAWLICRRVDPLRSDPPPARGFRVAFITTFVPGSESLDMLRETLVTMLAADYPHDTWVLDEGNDKAAVALCRELGVQHFSRKGRGKLNRDRGRFMMKTKGGNHNAWYAWYGKRYDIVAQVDSDFKVRRDFLTSTIGYFSNPRVAFVGTPQIYGNMRSFIARGAAQQTYLFYGPIMRSLSRRKMTMLIGANHVVRVAALQDVGWYQGHLTEDLATGRRLHAKRWESVYVPKPLAIGEGPDTWTAYFNQQYRWAFGCMSIFFADIKPLLKMRRSHGFYYFIMEMFYFGGLTMGVSVVLLVLYYLLGWRAANIPIESLLIWYSPVVLWRQLMVLWLQRYSVRPKVERGMLWTGRLLTIAVLPIYLLAFIGVVRSKRVTFKTTPKGNGRPQATDSLRVFLPHLVIAGLLACALGVGLDLGHTVWVFLAWGAVTIVLYPAFACHLLWHRFTDARREKRAARAMTTALIVRTPPARELAGSVAGRQGALPGTGDTAAAGARADRRCRRARPRRRPGHVRGWRHHRGHRRRRAMAHRLVR